MNRTTPRAVLMSTEFLGVMVFLFAVIFPPFDDATEVDLSIHMLQHVVIILSGVMMAYPLYKRKVIPTPSSKWIPNAVLTASAAAIVFWHLPVPWDAAVLNPLIHAGEHFTFLLVGIAIGSVLQALSETAKIAALLAAFFGHMAYAVVLIIPTNTRVYALYSVADQATLGWALVLSGWTFLIGVGYLLAKNPSWLAAIPGGGAPQPRPKKERRPMLPRSTAAFASLALIFILVAYFTGTAIAVIKAPNHAAQGVSTVYIAETPVSWQYAPQNIRVVIGVNSTVMWLSHSVSYDTVTENTGLFDSGVIAPGGSFTYTFTSPGVFGYHCVFHPWMVGTVTVMLNSR